MVKKRFLAKTVRLSASSLFLSLPRWKTAKPHILFGLSPGLRADCDLLISSLYRQKGGLK